MLASELKTGTIYKEANSPFEVLKYSHTKTARGGATVKIKARNLITGQYMEKTYLSSAKVEDADVKRKNAQYLYKDNDYIFMDPDTYEQFSVSGKALGEEKKFLVEGQKVLVMYFEEKPVSVELPITMNFKVQYTEPGHKGNTVSNVMKDATLENGAKVKVPTFIKIGDSIKINTREGVYVSKS